MIATPIRALQYPIGTYTAPAEINENIRRTWISDLERFPKDLENTVCHLPQSLLDSEYRPGGWTVRQVVHHLADSHLNSLLRFRLALTEDNPTIKAYREDKWAELPDAKRAPIQMSLTLLEGLHARWVSLLQSMTEEQFGRTFQHPERGDLRLDWILGLYVWHGQHHLAQITNLLATSDLPS